MEKKTVLFIGLACAVLLLVGGYFLFRSDGDEQIINRQFDRLVELAAKQEQESFIVVISQSREMARFFTSEAVVEFGSPLPLIVGQNDLQGFLIQARQSVQSIEIRIPYRELEVAEDGTSARMEVEAEGRVSYGGDRGRENRRFVIDWAKEEGEWLIAKVTLEGGLGL
jgi:hypothetical protein